MKLSFVCIGNDEFEHLSQLLPELVKIGDEVVYVDCESKDGSAEMAERVGCRVLKRARHMNANINRSYAFEHVTGDWIFYVDPDERFSQAIVDEIRAKVQADPEICGFKIPRKNYFFGAWLKHGGQYPDHQYRIFKKGHGHFNNRHVHERLQVNGKMENLETPMEHFPYLTIAQFIKKFDFYSTFEAKYLADANTQITLKNSWKFLFFKPLTRFVRRYIFKGGFRDGIPGYFAALYDALGWMNRYFKLWEMKRQDLDVRGQHKSKN